MKQPSVSEPDAAGRSGVEDVAAEEDKKKKRADRFKIFHPDLEAEKLLKRARRFDVEHPELEEEKKKKRLDRFWTQYLQDQPTMEPHNETQIPNGATVTNGAGPVTKRSTSGMTDEEKRALRAQRFASTTTALSGTAPTATTKGSALTADEEMKNKRAERFGLSVLSDEQKKARRAARFAA